MDRPFPIITLSFQAVLFYILAVDLVFILIDLIAFAAEKIGWIVEVPPFIKITRDGSLPEDIGYLKWAIIFVALVWLSVRDRWWVPFRWALVFLLILVDDAVQIHETLGEFLSEVLPFPTIIQERGEEISELLAFAGMGIIAVALTATLFFRHGDVARKLSVRFLYIVIGLVLFGVLIDFLHQLIAVFSRGTTVDGYLPPLFSLIEDGGEMIVGSFATAYVLTLPGLETDQSSTQGSVSARQV